MEQRLLWGLAAAILAVLIAGWGVMIYRYCKLKKGIALMKRERKEREQEIELDRRKAEIVSLQSQINPHFLYNTLEVIRSEAIMNQDMDAAEMAEALANYFRYNISKRKDFVTVGEELDNIDNYISIQKRRFGERISYQVVFHSQEEEARHALMPKLILQPLVENSIYHGLEKKAEGGTVTVHITVTRQRLIIQVEDDGPGMDPQTLERVEQQIQGIRRAALTLEASKDKHGGIALANIHQRIQMLYGREYGLTFSATRQVGAEAEINIPYRTE